MVKNNRKFIAGAVCPECQSMDSLVLVDQGKSVECIECGYSQSDEERDGKSDNSAKPPGGDIIPVVLK
ncbi:MAG: YheV family putative metal-binding protein [Gammaproteobacteria bacterium]|nr:YheV family putative metal-binding protein [Gammaproteobacteria bacterium]MDH5630126.1 YheV family putative metal-binding protein [Gammaproteobacteria bacterium]